MISGKSRALLAVVAIVLATAAGLGLFWRAKNPPLKVERRGLAVRMTRDFGLVLQGASVRAVFTLANPLASPLSFEEPQFSCGGCTRLARPVGTIAPGQSKDVEVLFATSGKQGRTRQNVVLKGRGTRAPIYLLCLEGTVASVWLDRSHLDLGVLDRNRKRQAGVFVLAAGLRWAKVLDVTDPGAGVSAHLEKGTVDKIARESGIRCLAYVALEVDPACHRCPGRQVKSFTVRVGGVSAAPFPLHGTMEYHILGNATTTPPVINFGVAKTGQERSAESRVTWIGPKENPVNWRVETDDPWVRGTIREQKDGNLILRASLLPQEVASNRMVEGDIRIRGARGILLSLPYNGFVVK